MQQNSAIHSAIGPRNFKPLALTPQGVREYAGLAALGINIGDRELQQIIDKSAVMDSNDVGLNPQGLPTLTQASIAVPVQFLQNWLPGIVRYLTTARLADTLVGVSTVGAWEDEEIVQTVLEPTGIATPYGDYANIPLTSWNPQYNKRNLVRFELGLFVGRLEERRAARVRIDSSAEKRANTALGLEIQRNRVAFYGYNDGAGLTYGFLNDPALPAYQTLPNGASGHPTWSTKTFQEITADIRFMVATLQVQGAGNIIVKGDGAVAMTLAIPLAVDQYLSQTTDLGGYSVQQWLQETYPTIRVCAIPELADANGGASAGYLYAERVDDASSDDRQTFIQVVPSKYMALGVEQKAKGFLEDYTNATAGVMCKRPYAVVRVTGL